MRLPRTSCLLLVTLPVLGGAARGQDGATPTAPQAAVPAPDAQVPAWSPEERAALGILRDLRKKERPSDTDLAARLSLAGERVLPLFFQVLGARSVPALDATGAAQVLSEVQERAVLLALAQFERDPVLNYVGRALLGGGDVARRGAAIACIGAVGRANDLLQLFELAFPAEEKQPDERLSKILRRSVSAVLQRDPRAFEQLLSLRRVTRPELLAVLVEAVGAARDPRGLAYLAEIVYWNEGLILDVMSQVPLLGASGDESIDASMRVRMRAYLDEARPGPCRAAIPALVALSDTESIGSLIALLAAENTGLRENAHWGLKQLTGLTLAPTPEVWAKWHQGEQYWVVREKARTFQRLRDGDPAVVADALRDLVTHPLARKELTVALPDLLQNRFPQIRALACRSLGALGARDAVGKLVWALEDSDRNVSQAAHAALRALTRLDLPREPLAWQNATHTEPRGTEL